MLLRRCIILKCYHFGLIQASECVVVSVILPLYVCPGHLSTNKQTAFTRKLIVLFFEGVGNWGVETRFQKGPKKKGKKKKLLSSFEYMAKKQSRVVTEDVGQKMAHVLYKRS